MFNKLPTYYKKYGGSVKIKNMYRANLELGKWLGGMEWHYFATVRPHYSLSPTASDRMMSRLTRINGIDNIFYALERDRDCNMNHAHLMLKTSKQIDWESLSKALGLNNKAVGYFDSILSPEAVSYYCTKYISKSFSHYNFF